MASNHYHKGGNYYWGRNSKERSISPQVYENTMNTLNALQTNINSLELMSGRAQKNLERSHLLGQRPSQEGGFVEFPPIEFEILPTITIPRGFRLGEDTSRYSLQLSVDEHALDIIAEEEFHEGVISVPNREGQIVTFNAEVLVVRVSLIGSLFYNLVVTGHRAVEPLGIDRETVFSLDPSIPVNVVLGYVTLEYYEALEQEPFDDYVITVTQGEEYLITETGEIIERSNPLFFSILQEGDQEIRLQVPYIITVSPSESPVC